MGVSGLAVPVGVVGIVLLLVIPIPAVLLDMLIAFNITIALVILLTSMYVRRPLEFAIFPSLLLVFTLFRLGLNVASTRLVLAGGYAGKVIDAFGSYVVSGSLVIGLVIFSILVVIQFVVITNGAGRVAEVGARFTLDAMPGKQMAIDADLNSGLIDEDTARKRRAEVSAEADFYGAMDGGSKFVKGDAIAGIVITLINLVGGFVIGMVQRDMSPGEALSTYSLLTVGDGLVSQIPALLMSVSTGLIVTRATTQSDMGTDAAAQLTQHKPALQIAGGAAVVFALIPGMPKLPFLLVGSGLLLAAQRTRTDDAPAEPDDTESEAGPALPQPDSPAALMSQMRVDPLEIVLSADIIDLVDTGTGGDLLERVRSLRRKVALELGFVVPPVRTRDSIDLPSSTYVIRISGVEVSRGQAPPGKVLALGENLTMLPGNPTTEPVFGLSGRWVPVELRHQAEMMGATVVDRASVLVTHLAEIIRTHAARLLSREDTRALVDSVKADNPALVEELVPGALSLGEVQRVLQALLDEAVPVRDLPHVFEGLSLRAKTSTDLDSLVEAARTSLGPAIAAQHAVDGILNVVTLDPAMEQMLAESVRPGEHGATLSLLPGPVESLLQQLAARQADAENSGQRCVLAVSPGLRLPMRRLLALGLPKLPVLSYAEVTSGGLQINTVGTVTHHDALTA
ncbi:MAG: flagellar biosynthesis protein FlhA [Micrococcales bacterium]|nr:MAG: flagellar biosynthesis protein FlhA [Micrococcales bacterium]PIE27241.1 MAG: flagellar biosynthesis protein FlhA [Micrococcales bacterium]